MQAPYFKKVTGDDILSNGKAKAITKKRLGLDEDSDPPTQIRLNVSRGALQEYILFERVAIVAEKYAEYHSIDPHNPKLYLLPQLPYPEKP